MFRDTTQPCFSRDINYTHQTYAAKLRIYEEDIQNQLSCSKTVHKSNGIRFFVSLGLEPYGERNDIVHLVLPVSILLICI